MAEWYSVKERLHHLDAKLNFSEFHPDKSEMFDISEF